jgi:PAS domain-containing protein
VESGRQKHLVLILAREFASMLATPMFVADENGRLVFFNEPAEAFFGQSFAETGEISAEEWTSLFAPATDVGDPLPFDARPSGIAFKHRRPAHGTLQVTRADGQTREIASSAFPLFARAEEFVGVISIFWEQPG